MLHLCEVIYEKINDVELPEELFKLYGDEIYGDEMVLYVLAKSSSEASDVAWLYFPAELEDCFEETSNNDIQGCYIDDDFIDNYQEEIKKAKNLIIKWHGRLDNDEEEYFNTYLKEK